jgi:FkbH-like protein
MHDKFLNLNRYSDQPVLFASRPTRLAIQSLEAPSGACCQFTINVWRNHAFEPLEPLVRPYAHFGRWAPDFRLSGYDDSFLFAGHRPAKAELVWLDPSRLPEELSWTDWVAVRLTALRVLSNAPIVLATWPRGANDAVILRNIVDTLPATYLADLNAEAEVAGVPLLDPRSSRVAGTPLSSACHLAIARKLACHWLAAAVLPPIKAVALDLDNTLHQGVLGEDGLEGVAVTPAHAALQRHAAALSQRGTYIALVSRNRREDVRELFEKRRDYPLRWSDFSATEISWDEKADAVARVASALRIGQDAVLFVDDNIGELASLALKAPTVHTLHAHDDPAVTLRALEYYPGLWRWKTEAEDAKRVHDLRANAERETLAQTILDPGEYFHSLQVTLRFRHDPLDQLGRLADLCRKTNQFNLALRRLTEAEVADRLASPNACIASVQLRDRLSDSGIIAIIVAERKGTDLLIEELCISCRAMGRHLENTIVLAAVRAMPVFDGATTVSFRVRHGPRNQPALEWLAAILGAHGAPAEGLHALDARMVRDFSPAAGVELQLD